jgi:hypothetical protein
MSMQASDLISIKKSLAEAVELLKQILEAVRIPSPYNIVPNVPYDQPYYPPYNPTWVDCQNKTEVPNEG